MWLDIANEISIFESRKIWSKFGRDYQTRNLTSELEISWSFQYYHFELAIPKISFHVLHISFDRVEIYSQVSRKRQNIYCIASRIFRYVLPILVASVFYVSFLVNRKKA